MSRPEKSGPMSGIVLPGRVAGEMTWILFRPFGVREVFSNRLYMLACYRVGLFYPGP